MQLQITGNNATLHGVASVFCPWSSFESIIRLSHVEEQNPLEAVKQQIRIRLYIGSLALKITKIFTDCANKVNRSTK